MSLRHALLSLLTVEPMTGYDLYKVFESSVGHVWHAPDSQIYPELKRMESEGLVTGEDVPWGQRGKKRQYTITKEGIVHFQNWINTPLEYARTRDPAHLKAAYLEWAEPEAAREQMRGHILHHQALLWQWQERIDEFEQDTNPMLTKRLKIASPERREATIAYKRFTYEGLIARAEAEIRWATRGLELIDKLNP